MSEPINSAGDYPAGKFANRSLVRTVVFQMLYQEDLNTGSINSYAETYFAQELPKHLPLLQFARQLLSGTVLHQKEIDGQIASIARNWTLERINCVDRNILRLAAFEILFTDLPKAVAINEAVELAKKFGTKDSPGFVNGILDRLKKAD
ncbi:MAG: transcription antitermination factor NusB [Planctomycetaceae bacterium]|jgi:N utilization substance protein B|nr:transcription antitermination factor NusB [Planctomycetaceae bacterium]